MLLKATLFLQTRISLVYDVRKHIWTFEDDIPKPVMRQQHVKGGIKGTILACFIDEGISVNAAMFRQQLRALRARLSCKECVRWKLLKSLLQKARTGLLSQRPYFLIDIAHPYTAHTTAKLLAKFKCRNRRAALTAHHQITTFFAR